MRDGEGAAVVKINVVDRMAKQLAGVETTQGVVYISFVKDDEYDSYTAVLKTDGYELTFPVTMDVRIQVVEK